MRGNLAGDELDSYRTALAIADPEDRSDDVIVRVRDETDYEPVRYFRVHLTYNMRPEPPPWPDSEDVTFTSVYW